MNKLLVGSMAVLAIVLSLTGITSRDVAFENAPVQEWPSHYEYGALPEMWDALVDEYPGLDTLGEPDDIDLAAFGDTLYIAGDNGLYSINVTTGAVTRIGSVATPLPEN